jgi:hypothetical protein
MPARSVRVADDVWERAKRRATYEGSTISHVTALFVEGYANGLLNAPRVRVVYDSATTVEPGTTVEPPEQAAASA